MRDRGRVGTLASTSPHHPARSPTSKSSGSPPPNESTDPAEPARSGVVATRQQGHAPRQFHLIQPRPGVDAVLHRPAEHVPVRRQSVGTGFTNDARGVLGPLDPFTRGSTFPDLGIHRREARVELSAVVERRDHHVPPFPTGRVIPIVPHHEPADAVVIHIDLSHAPRLRPATPPAA